MIKVKKEKLLITPKDIKSSSKDFEVIGTTNPGAMRLPNGNIVLYVRVIEKFIKNERKNCCFSPRMTGKNKFKIKLDKFSRKIIKEKSNMDILFKDGTKRLTFISHFRRVILDKTGFKILSIDKKPSFYGVSWDGELGIEDPRITKVGDLYVMTYVSLSRKENVSTSYAISNDCFNWYRRGVIFGEENKDAVIFPELINNKYYSFNRPAGGFHFSLPHIWIVNSKDLEYWGEPKPIFLAKKGDWDYGTNGAGVPPIKTKDGWLLIYHAVKEKIEKDSSLLAELEKLIGIKKEREISYYLVGAALFDLKNPEKLIAKSGSPILIPHKKYEKGTFEDKRVIFPTGLVVDKNKKGLLIYSGAGDAYTTVKKVALREIMGSLEKV